jgi:hypothetical protein
MNPLLFATVALIFALASALAAFWAWKRAIAAAKYAEDCAHWVNENNKRAKIVRLEAELTQLFDSVASVRESMHKIRSRLAMRERREKEKNGQDRSEFPNTAEGRDAERAALEKELAESGRLNPRIHLQGRK